LRGEVLDLLLSRPDWARMTLDAVRMKQLLPHEVGAVRRNRLLRHKDESVHRSAVKVFAAPSNRERSNVVDDYWLQLPDKGDLERGAKLFARSCAGCHQLGGVGTQIGRDLASLGDKSQQELLVAILDPNRVVEARYMNYKATTKAGLTFSGILTSETSTSITLIGNGGKSQQILRTELDELTSTGKSMMPEGLEKHLSVQDMADVIEFVRSIIGSRGER
jgi:putative heme-binding domain-containing protein